MSKCVLLFLLGLCVLESRCREPFKPRMGSVPFMVYIPSRYRGICSGFLVSRTAVMTAAVCVVHPDANVHDTNAINVIVGTMYRHPKRGVRVQVTRKLLPNLSNYNDLHRRTIIEVFPAILILKRKIPDALTEVPMRPLAVKWEHWESLKYNEEFLTFGWHFFYNGDQIYEGHKFLLQRNLRGQFVVNSRTQCDALFTKLHNAYKDYQGFRTYCIRDPDRSAQPCHGMYGSPIISHGVAIGMMTAPDGQWTNCTGFSNTFQYFRSVYIRGFMSCVSSRKTSTTTQAFLMDLPIRGSCYTHHAWQAGWRAQYGMLIHGKTLLPISRRLFDPAPPLNWVKFKKNVYDEYEEEFDYLPEIYDTLSGEKASEEL